jgi:predicted TIM-barrel fold metal-dependent hydrolase
MTPRPADAFPATDAEVPGFVADLGLDGIVDFHVHGLPEALQQAVWRYFDGLDAPPWPIHYRASTDELLARLRRLGVAAHPALAYAHRPGMLGWLNDFTLDLAERHDQVVPTFTIYPDPDVGERTAEALDRNGAIVKVHLQVGRFHATDPRLDDAWSQIADHRLPVVLHATAVYGVDGGREYCGIDAVRALLDRHPGLVVVLAHLGMPDFDATAALLAEHPEVYADTAMVPQDGPLAQMPTPALLEQVRAHPDRLVFGTDYPSIPHDYATQVRGLATLGFDDDELRGVLAGNARRLLAAADRTPR